MGEGMTESVEYRLGSLDARMTNVETRLESIATDQKSQSTKLDTLLSRTAAVQEVRRHSWKAVIGGLTAITAVIEGAHQLSKLFHGGGH
jgi:hypothetical protein